jgi:hypothetical protein
LIEHHGASGDGQPLSRKRIQEDLGWKLSDVQRIMADIFGNRPFAAYKQKCSEGTIGDFVESWTPNCLDSQHTISARPTLQSV